MEGVRKINDILEHLNVDATNPLAVLTQVGWGAARVACVRA